ncbi:hypothetical protein ACOSQ3_020439 [Xanthoceras sorbifolium]
MKYVKPFQLYHEIAKDVVRRKEPSKVRALIGLHVDNKHVRMAVTNPLVDPDSRITITTKKLDGLPRQFAIDSMTKELLTLIKDFRAIGFIFGDPNIKLMDMRDDAHPKFFIDDLRKTGKFEDLKYTYWNMSFMSKYMENNFEKKVDRVISFYDPYLYPFIATERKTPRSTQSLRRAEHESRMENIAHFMLQGFLDCGVMLDGPEMQRIE